MCPRFGLLIGAIPTNGTHSQAALNYDGVSGLLRNTIDHTSSGKSEDGATVEEGHHIISEGNYATPNSSGSVGFLLDAAAEGNQGTDTKIGVDMSTGVEKEYTVVHDQDPTVGSIIKNGFFGRG